MLLTIHCSAISSLSENRKKLQKNCKKKNRKRNKNNSVSRNSFRVLKMLLLLLDVITYPIIFKKKEACCFCLLYNKSIENRHME